MFHAPLSTASELLSRHRRRNRGTMTARQEHENDKKDGPISSSDSLDTGPRDIIEARVGRVLLHRFLQKRPVVGGLECGQQASHAKPPANKAGAPELCQWADGFERDGLCIRFSMLVS